MASYASSECHDACISQQTVPVSELAVSVDAVSVCGRVLGGVHQQMNVVGHLEHGFPLRQTMVRTRQYRHTHDATVASVSTIPFRMPSEAEQTVYKCTLDISHQGTR